MKNFFLRQFSGKTNSSVQQQASSLLIKTLFPALFGLLFLSGTFVQAQVCSDYRLLVANYGGDNITSYNTAGTSSTVLIGPGSGANAVAQPNAVLLYRDTLYVANSAAGTNNIKKYNPVTGVYYSTFVPTSAGLSFPEKMIIGPDGNMYVTSYNSDQIFKFNINTGVTSATFSAGTATTGPIGIEFIGNDMYVTLGTINNTGANQTGQLVRYMLNSTFTAITSTTVLRTYATGSTARGITLGPDGALYLIVNVGGVGARIERVTSTGTATTFLTMDAGSVPYQGISWSPDNFLYVADFGENEVQVYNASGAEQTARRITALLNGPHYVQFYCPCNAQVTFTPTSLTTCPGTPVSVQVITTNVTPQIRYTFATSTPSLTITGPSTTTSTSNTITVGASTSVTGTFSVTVSGRIGCFASASATVTVRPAPTLTTSVSNTLTCATTVATVSVTPSPAGSTVAWQGPGSFTSTATSFTTSTSGSYTVTATAPNGCTATAVATVQQNTIPPSVSVTASTNAACSGQRVTLNTQTSGGSFTVTAPTGVTLSSATASVITTSPLATGVNTFTVTASNGPLCLTTTTVSVSVADASTSLLTLTASQSAICLGQTVTLSTSITGITGLLLGTASIGVSNPLTGGILNTVPSGVFSPTATTTLLASIPILNILGNPIGALTSCPITVIVNQPPSVSAVSLSVCAGTSLNLTSLTGLIGSGGLGNVFRTGGIPGVGTTVTTPTISLGPNNLFNVVSTSPLGCTASTPISITGVPAPVIAPIALSLCIGASLDLNSLTALTGVGSLTNVFSNGLLGGGGLLGTSTVTIGAGANLFNVVSTSPLGCTASTPISITGVPAPVIAPIALSLCIGASLDLNSLTALTGVGSLTNVFSGGLLGGGGLLGTSTVTIGAGANLFNVVSTSPLGCTASTPISITGVPAPVIAPIALSLCIGASLDLNSLTALTGVGSLTNVFSNGLLGGGGLLGTSTVTIGAGANLFNVVSTSPLGCTASTPISITGVPAPVIAPIALSLCIGASLDLNSLTALTGVGSLTNVFSGGLLGGGGLLGTSTVTIGAGANLFNVVSTSPLGCTASTPISITGVPAPSLLPISLSLCIGASLDLNSLTALTGVGSLTNVFSGGLLGGGGLLGTSTVTIGAGANLFNVVSTSPLGCTASTPISITGVPAPVIAPIALSLCIGASLDLNSLTALTGVGSLTNVFSNGLLGGGGLLGTSTVTIGAGANLFNVVSTSPLGCTASTPISITGVPAPSLLPISLSLCIGASLDLNSLTALTGVGSLTNVFSNGLLGGGGLLGTSTVTIGAGANLFNVVSTSPLGCTASTPISITGVPAPSLLPISLSLCIGASLDLNSLTALTGVGSLTNVFSNGLLGGGGLLGTSTVTIGAGANLFNVVSTSPLGCTASTPISITGVPAPVIAPIALSLCIGASLDLNSLTALTGVGSLTNVFSNGLLGGGGLLGTSTVTIGAGANLFNVVSTSPLGCTTSTPISITGVPAPSLLPISLSLCIGASLDLNSLTALTGVGSLTNVFSNGLLGGGGLLGTSTVTIGAGANLFNVVSTSPLGCTASTPISITGVPAPVIAPIALSLCIGASLDLNSLTALTGVGSLTNVFSNGLLGGGGLLGTSTVTIGAGANLFNVVSTSPLGCTASTPISITGVPAPVIAPIALSLCIGASLDLNSLTALTGVGSLTNVFSGGLLGGGGLLGTSTVTIGAGANLFNVVSTSPLGCTASTPISITGVPAPVIAPIALSLCIGASLDLNSLTALTGVGSLTNVFSNGLLGGGGLLGTSTVTIGAGANLFNVVSTSPLGCTASTPISITGVPAPVIAPIALSLCIGASLDLNSLTALTGVGSLTNVFSNGLLGGGGLLGTSTVTIGAGANLFNVVSTSPLGCTASTPISITGVPAPSLLPISLSLCIGASLDLNSLTALTGVGSLTNVFSNGLLGGGGLLGTSTVTIGAGANLFNVVSTSPLGCTASTPISITGVPAPSLLPISLSLCIGASLDLNSLTALTGVGSLTNVFSNGLLGGGGLLGTSTVTIGAGANLFNVVSTSPLGCTTSTPISITGVPAPSLLPISLSLCIGASLDLNSLTALTGVGSLTNVFSNGLLGGGGLLGTSTVTIGAGANLFNVVSTSPLGCTTSTPISITGVPAPSLLPISLSLCIGASLDLNSLTALTGVGSLTNVFSNGLLGGGGLLGTSTVTIGAGANLFNVVSTSPLGCTASTPISITGVPAPSLLPISLSLCIGASLDLNSLTALTGVGSLTNVFSNGLLGGGGLLGTSTVTIGAGANLFNVVSTSPLGCTASTPISITGVPAPSLLPISLSLCIGASLDLNSLTALTGVGSLTNVFSNGLLGGGGLLGTSTVTIGAGANLFNVVSTSPLGCTTSTPISITGVPAPSLLPISLSLCIGASLDLNSLTALTGVGSLTNVFSNGLLGGGGLLGTSTVTIGAGANLFNVVSTSPLGCTASTPISITGVPAPVIAPIALSLCIGASLDLNSLTALTGVGSLTNVFSNGLLGGGGLLGTSTVTIGAGANLFNVVSTSPLGCTASTPISITGVPAPSLLPISLSLCIGASLDLNSLTALTGVGSLTNVFSGGLLGGGGLLGTSTVTIGAGANLFNVVSTSPLGCTASTPISITGVPAPSLLPISLSLCIGASLDLNSLTALTGVGSLTNVFSNGLLGGGGLLGTSTVTIGAGANLFNVVSTSPLGCTASTPISITGVPAPVIAPIALSLCIGASLDLNSLTALTGVGSLTNVFSNGLLGGGGLLGTSTVTIGAGANLFNVVSTSPLGCTASTPISITGVPAPSLLPISLSLCIGASLDLNSLTALTGVGSLTNVFSNGLLGGGGLLGTSTVTIGAGANLFNVVSTSPLGCTASTPISITGVPAPSLLPISLSLCIGASLDLNSLTALTGVGSLTNVFSGGLLGGGGLLGTSTVTIGAGANLFNVVSTSPLGCTASTPISITGVPAPVIAPIALSLCIGASLDLNSLTALTGVGSLTNVFSNGLLGGGGLLGTSTVTIGAGANLFNVVSTSPLGCTTSTPISITGVPAPSLLPISLSLCIGASLDLNSLTALTGVGSLTNVFSGGLLGGGGLLGTSTVTIGAGANLFNVVSTSPLGCTASTPISITGVPAPSLLPISLSLCIGASLDLNSLTALTGVGSLTNVFSGGLLGGGGLLGTSTVTIGAGANLFNVVSTSPLGCTASTPISITGVPAPSLLPISLSLCIGASLDLNSLTALTGVGSLTNVFSGGLLGGGGLLGTSTVTIGAGANLFNVVSTSPLGCTASTPISITGVPAPSLLPISLSLCIGASLDLNSLTALTGVGSLTNVFSNGLLGGGGLLGTSTVTIGAGANLFNVVSTSPLGCTASTPISITGVPAPSLLPISLSLCIGASLDLNSLTALTGVGSLTNVFSNGLLGGGGLLGTSTVTIGAGANLFNVVSTSPLGCTASTPISITGVPAPSLLPISLSLCIGASLDLNSLTALTGVGSLTNVFSGGLLGGGGLLGTSTVTIGAGANLFNVVSTSPLGCTASTPISITGVPAPSLLPISLSLCIGASLDLNSLTALTGVGSLTNVFSGGLLGGGGLLGTSTVTIGAGANLFNVVSTSPLGCTASTPISITGVPAPVIAPIALSLCIGASLDLNSLTALTGVGSLTNVFSNGLLGGGGLLGTSTVTIGAGANLFNVVSTSPLGCTASTPISITGVPAPVIAPIALSLCIGASLDLNSLTALTGVGSLTNVFSNGLLGGGGLLGTSTVTIGAGANLFNVVSTSPLGCTASTPISITGVPAPVIAPIALSLCIGASLDLNSLTALTGVGSLTNVFSNGLLGGGGLLGTSTVTIGAGANLFNVVSTSPLGCTASTPISITGVPAPVIAPIALSLCIGASLDLNSLTALTGVGSLTNVFSNGLLGGGGLLGTSTVTIGAGANLFNVVSTSPLGCTASTPISITGVPAPSLLPISLSLCIGASLDLNSLTALTGVGSLTNVFSGGLLGGGGLLGTSTVTIGAGANLFNVVSTSPLGCTASTPISITGVPAPSLLPISLSLCIGASLDLNSLTALTGVGSLTNVFSNGLLGGGGLLGTSTVTIGAGANLFNVVSTSPLGCTASTPISITGVPAPSLLPISLSLCIGASLDLNSLTALTGVGSLTNVFSNGLLGGGGLLGTSTVTIGAGANLFNVVSTSPLGCTASTPISITGVPAPSLLPISLSLCIGASLDLNSLTALTGVGSLTNVFSGGLLGGGGLLGTSTVTIGAGANLFNVVSTSPLGCTASTPISITGVPAPSLLPISLSLCIGASLDLNSLTALTGVGSLTNVFSGGLLGGGGLLGTSTVTIGAGANLFNVVSTSPLGCTASTPISITGVPAPVIAPIALSLCIGASLDLNSLTALTGVGSLTNVFSNGLLGGGGLLGTSTVTIGAGANLFNVVSTSPLGCTASTPISITGVPAPSLLPISLSLCIGASLDLNSLTALTGVGSLTNVFSNGLLGGGGLLGTSTVTIGAGANLFNVVSTSPLGCTASTPISITGVPAPVIAPIALSLCIGASLDLNSLTALTGVGSLTNVFSNGLLGGGGLLGTSTVTIGAGANLFNVVSTSPLGCTASTPISITGVPAPSLLPISLSLCIGASLDLNSLTALTGVGSLTNVFSNGLLGGGGLLGTSTVTIGAGANLFNVVSTSPLGCTASTPISITGVPAPSLLPISLSLCIGASLDLNSLTALTGVGSLTNVFSNGLLGGGGLLGTSTVTIGAGANLFNVVSTSPLGCTTSTPISITGVPAPSLLPISLSLCIGASLDLNSLTALTGVGSLTNVFSNGLLGGGGLLGTSTVTIGAGANLFNVVSTSPLGCTASTPISITGVPAPSLLPISLSLCIGASLDLNSLTALTGVGSLTNVFSNGLLGGGGLLGTSTVTIGAGANLFNVVSTSPLGCTASTPISITGVPAPVIAPIALSLCIGASLDLNSLTALTGVGSLTNVFSNGLLGGGGLLGTSTVTIGAGANLFNVVSTSPLGCTASTPISITGVPAPVIAPIALSLCIGASLDLNSLTALTGVGSLTNVFSGGLLGGGGLLGTSTVTIGAGANLFNVVSTSPLGCTASTPISITGVPAPVIAPIALSLCIGASLDLNSLSGLAGLTNVFRTGNVLGLGDVLGTPTAVSISAGANLFNVVSTSPLGCTAATPISVTGVDVPVTTPVNLTLCATVGTPVNLSTILASTGSVAGLTNTFLLGGLTGSVIANPVAVSLAAGVNLFTVTSTNPTGCTIITPIQVTLDIKPAISVAANLQSQTICEGSAPLPIVATVTSGTISGSLFFGPLADTTSLFSTTVGAGLSFTPTAAQLPAAGQTFFFALVANGTSSCSDTVFVAITTVPRPVVATTSLTICLGETVDLTAQLATQAGNGSAFFTTLLNAQAQVSPLASLTVAPTVTTTFFTRVTLPVTGCFAIDSIVVSVNPKPSAGTDQTLVCGPLGETPASATLTATPLGGSWSNGAGNPTVASFTPNSASTTVGGLAVGSYQFIYTTGGCQDTVVVVVPVCQTICASVSVTALASSLTITPDQSVSLSASVSPAGSYTFAWSGPGVITPTNGATVVASSLTTGVSTFTVTVTTSPGCTTTATVSVTVVAPAPLLGISITDPGVCDPGTNTYNTTGVLSFTNAVAGILTITDGTSTITVSVTAGQTTASFSQSGLISGTGTHTVTVGGVGYPTISTTYVAPEACPVVVCDLVVTATTASATVAQGQSASLTAIVSPAGSYTYTWTAPAGITTTPGNASAVTTSGLPSGTYTFTVTVASSASCTQTATVCVSVPFTPCANSNYAFSLTTVAGFGNYQWQYTAPGSASSTVVQSSSANSYVATLPGEYRVVITDGGVSNCPGNSCCPILIVELPAPVALSVTAIAATCSTTSPAAENNAQLVLSGTTVGGTSYNISIGSTFMEMGTLFPTNQPLSGLTTGSILRTGLLNPSTAAGDTYTVRVFTADGCFADTVVTIPRSDCQCPPAKCVPITVRKVVRVR